MPATVPYVSSWRGPGLSVVWRQTLLRWLLVLTPITLILTFGMIDLFIYQGWQDLGQNAANLGAMVAAAAVGALAAGVAALAAGVAAGPLRRKFGFGACWIGSLIVAGLAVASLAV